MSSALIRLAQRINSIEQELASSRTPQLAYSSVEVDGVDVGVAEGLSAAMQASSDLAGALDRITDAEARLDGVVQTYYTDTEPADPSEGDLWFRATDKKLSRYTAGAWVEITDQTAIDAAAAAQDAQTTADGKITTFYQPDEPASGVGGEGDLWFDTDAGNAIKVLKAGVWTALPIGTGAIAPGAVTEVVVASDAIGSAAIKQGAIDTDHINLGVLRTNLVADPSLEESYTLTSWTDPGQGNVGQWRVEANAGASVTRNARYSRSGSKQLTLRRTASATATSVARGYTSAMKLEAGKSYNVTWNATSYGAGSNTDGGGGLTVEAWFGATASTIANGAGTVVLSDGSLVPYTSSTQTTAATYVAYSNTLDVPAGATDLYVTVRFSHTGTTADSYVIVDDISVVEIGLGGASELTAAGLRLFDNEGNECAALVSNRPNYWSITSDGQTVASISAAGVATFADLNVTDDPSIGGVPLAGRDLADNQYDYYPAYDTSRDLSVEPVGLIEGKAQGYVGEAWHNASEFSTAVVANGGRIDLFQIDAQLMPNRQYVFMTTPITVNVTTAPGRLALVARRTTDGSQPTYSSSILHREYVQVPNTGWQTVQIAYRPIGGGTWQSDTRILVSIAAESGAAFQMISSADPVGAAVMDVGFAKRRTGTLRNQIVAPAASNPTPTVTKKTYTSAWIASNSESYGNYGARSESNLFQGYYSSNQGSQWASIVFADANSTGGERDKTVGQALTGATIKKVEVYLRNAAWYYNSGGTAYIRAQNSTSLITSTPAGTAKAFGGWAVGAGKWVDITSIASASIRGITLGKAPSGLGYYGQFYNHTSSSKPQLRITYEK